MTRAVPLLLMIAALPVCHSEERVDNVLARLVPPDSVSLFGARMEQLKSTPLYQKLVGQQKLPQLDEFTEATGFDPRRDVRDLLVASSGKAKSGVLLARGSFHITAELSKMKELRRLDYHGYVIWTNPAEDSGFCIMDSTLAIAGPIAGLHEALDQYKAKPAASTAALLTKARAVPNQFQLWVVSTGGADFIANNLPDEGPAANFRKIFHSLENTNMEADLSHGLAAIAEGNCRTDLDAKNLGDAARGLIGFGRLSVPDNQPELLRIWDNIQVERADKTVRINANIPQELIDRMIQLFGPSSPAAPKANPRK